MSVGPEAEFFLFKRGDENRPTLDPHDHASYFDVDPRRPRRGHAPRHRGRARPTWASTSRPRTTRSRSASTRSTSATPTRSRCADNLITFRWVVKHAAARNGMHATFMPKPIYGENGSGMHVNQSLSRGGENAFFDPNDELQLSATAYGYIAGLLEHLPAITAICNPTVNSYKRLIPGYEAPVYIAWSPGNRSAAIRIPAKRGRSTRAELRTPDPDREPVPRVRVPARRPGSTACARGLRPPAPVNVNIYHLTDEESAGLGIEGLPHNLEDALTALEADSVLRNGARRPHLRRLHQREARRVGRLPRAGPRLGVQAVPRPVLGAAERRAGLPHAAARHRRRSRRRSAARREQLGHVGHRDVVAAARVRVRVEQLRDLLRAAARAAPRRAPRRSSSRPRARA